MIHAGSETVDVANITAWTTDPQITIESDPGGVTVINEHATQPVYVSFDGGTTIAGHIDPAVIRYVGWDQPIRKIWLRVDSNPGGTCNVQALWQG